MPLVSTVSPPRRKTNAMSEIFTLRIRLFYQGEVAML
jgi:hypothetical protein